MSKQDGGPAFPVQGFAVDASGAFCQETVKATGLTLRDYFAAKAMQSVVARLIVTKDEETAEFRKVLNGCNPNTFYANTAYVIADAMLEARSK